MNLLTENNVDLLLKSSNKKSGSAKWQRSGDVVNARVGIYAKHCNDVLSGAWLSYFSRLKYSFIATMAEDTMMPDNNHVRKRDNEVHYDDNNKA